MALIDVCLSKTQRGTPTVIHPQYNIVKIRTFYTRKVKHAGGEFVSRLGAIITEFPRLEDAHPFYADLIGVLYDRDHYKIALGHVNAVKNVIENVSKGFVKLLKFGNSPYRCKQLKRAALGRMASAAKKLKKTLEYLEEIRMHMTRLPSIDPSARTLLICGFPNVGKSSFVNKISRAAVEVQPYAFTTKSLYVGHFDYKHLQWQVIDTPGILDHPLEDRNTIEMLSITALAHINAVVLYFIDVSESCGFSTEEQMNLFNTLSPLLNSNLVVVLSKSDLLRLDDAENKAVLLGFLEGKRCFEISTENEEGIDAVKAMACDMLLDERVERKESSGKISEYINRIMITLSRNPKRKEEPHICRKRVGDCLEDEQRKYFVSDEYKYKYDVIPEIMDGKNVADFFDEDIEEKLLEIEEEERKLFSSMYCKSYDVLSAEERAAKEIIANRIEERRIVKRLKRKRTLPKLQTLKQKDDGDGVMVQKKYHSGNVQIQLSGLKSKSKKKAKFDDGGKYYDKMPKHLYRNKKRSRR